MWIRTQDKSELVNVIRVNISSIFGDKKGKAMIWGQFAANGFLSESRVNLGVYKTKEDAVKVIDEIQAKIIEDPNGIYEMK